MLGLSRAWAMIITTAVLLVYITLGGAHADILTDALQGLLMLALAFMILLMFLFGVGSNGLINLVENLRAQDPRLLQPFHPDTAITASVWSLITVTVAHIPLGMLPHIGNKLWALREERQRTQFITMAFVFGLILPAITLGGATARAVLGDSLLQAGHDGANNALPALFIEIFPAWLAALLGTGILAAVMSTADGLVISTSQVFANDIYRRSIAPRLHATHSQAELDRNVLFISRAVTSLTLIGSAALAWHVLDKNVVLLIWAGIGGFTAALMGPLFLGSLWRGVTRSGALAGFWSGALVFVLIHAETISADWFTGSVLEEFGQWFAFNARSPYSAATLGGIFSMLVTVLVSLFTEPLSREHLLQVMGQYREKHSYQGRDIHL